MAVAQLRGMTIKKILAILFMTTAMLTLSVGCVEEEGPMEQAGEEIDEAFGHDQTLGERIGDHVEERVDEATGEK